MKSKANTTESDLITDGELVSGKHGRDYVATEEKNYGWVLNITFKAEKKTYKDYVCQLHTDGVVWKHWYHSYNSIIANCER